MAYDRNKVLSFRIFSEKRVTTRKFLRFNSVFHSSVGTSIARGFRGFATTNDTLNLGLNNRCFLERHAHINILIDGSRKRIVRARCRPGGLPRLLLLLLLISHLPLFGCLTLEPRDVGPVVVVVVLFGTVRVHVVVRGVVGRRCVCGVCWRGCAVVQWSFLTRCFVLRPGGLYPTIAYVLKLKLVQKITFLERKTYRRS